MNYMRKSGTNTIHIQREGAAALCGASLTFNNPIPESTVKALGKMVKVCKRCESLRKKAEHS